MHRPLLGLPHSSAATQGLLRGCAAQPRVVTLVTAVTHWSRPRVDGDHDAVLGRHRDGGARLQRLLPRQQPQRVVLVQPDERDLRRREAMRSRIMRAAETAKAI